LIGVSKYHPGSDSLTLRVDLFKTGWHIADGQAEWPIC